MVDTASLIFGTTAFSISVGTVLWRVIMLRLNSEVLALQHNLEIKDLQIENLQDVQTLLQKGLEEKFEHFASRMKGENLEIDKRLRQIENYLSKKTEFEPRD